MLALSATLDSPIQRLLSLLSLYTSFLYSAGEPSDSARIRRSAALILERRHFGSL